MGSFLKVLVPLDLNMSTKELRSLNSSHYCSTSFLVFLVKPSWNHRQSGTVARFQFDLGASARFNGTCINSTNFSWKYFISSRLREKMATVTGVKNFSSKLILRAEQSFQLWKLWPGDGNLECCKGPMIGKRTQPPQVSKSQAVWDSESLKRSSFGDDLNTRALNPLQMLPQPTKAAWLAAHVVVVVALVFVFGCLLLLFLLFPAQLNPTFSSGLQRNLVY